MEDLLLELDLICKSLQSATVATLVEQSQDLVERGDYPKASDILRQALQVESTNTQARSLLDKVNSELRGIMIRPKAQELVEKGLALFEDGRIQEARDEVENALRLDPSFEAAQELQRRLQQALDRSQLVSQYLEATKLRLAEGLPEEAEHLLSKVLELEPSNKVAKGLQEKVIKEKAEREQRIRLLDTMQQARSLWTLQKYPDCIQLLSELQREFPGEEEILRLLETAREEQAEQGRRQSLEKARSLLATGRHEECNLLLADLRKQFPQDEEIANLISALRDEESEQRKLHALAEARNLLAARHYDESIALLTKLQQEHPEDDEVARLVATVRSDQVEQHKLQVLSAARNLLAQRRYEECIELVTAFGQSYPDEEEINRLLE